MALFDSWRRSASRDEEVVAQPTFTTHADVEHYFRGALRLVRTDEGFIQPYRFSARQMELLARINRAKRAIATSGITIDFVTDGDTVSFDCRVAHTLDSSSRLYTAVMEHEGVLGEAENGVIDGIDVVAGGLRSYTTAVTDGTVELSFDNPDHDRMEVRIFLPYMMGVAVSELACNGSIEPAPERGYLLALGDSITQGFVVGCPSLTYPALVASALDLDLVNQGIAGHMFDRRTLSGIGAMRARPPRAIVVAFGTNDWARKGSPDAIRRGAERYLNRLVKAFPGVPAYILSPLWRADEDQEVPAGVPLTWVGELLEELCETADGLRYVDGYHSIPKNPVMLADGRLHPGSVDAGLVADALIERMMADGLDAPREGEGVLAVPRVEEASGDDDGAAPGVVDIGDVAGEEPFEGTDEGEAPESVEPADTGLGGEAPADGGAVDDAQHEGAALEGAGADAEGLGSDTGLAAGADDVAEAVPGESTDGEYALAGLAAGVPEGPGELAEAKGEGAPADDAGDGGAVAREDGGALAEAEIADELAFGPQGAAGYGVTDGVADGGAGDFGPVDAGPAPDGAELGEWHAEPDAVDGVDGVGGEGVAGFEGKPAAESAAGLDGTLTDAAPYGADAAGSWAGEAVAGGAGEAGEPVDAMGTVASEEAVAGYPGEAGSADDTGVLRIPREALVDVNEIDEADVEDDMPRPRADAQRERGSGASSRRILGRRRRLKDGDVYVVTPSPVDEDVPAMAGGGEEVAVDGRPAGRRRSRPTRASLLANLPEIDPADEGEVPAGLPELDLPTAATIVDLRHGPARGGAGRDRDERDGDLAERFGDLDNQAARETSQADEPAIDRRPEVPAAGRYPNVPDEQLFDEVASDTGTRGGNGAGRAPGAGSAPAEAAGTGAAAASAYGAPTEGAEWGAQSPSFGEPAAPESNFYASSQVDTYMPPVAATGRSYPATGFADMQDRVAAAIADAAASATSALGRGAVDVGAAASAVAAYAAKAAYEAGASPAEVAAAADAAASAFAREHAGAALVDEGEVIAAASVTDLRRVPDARGSDSPARTAGGPRRTATGDDASASGRALAGRQAYEPDWVGAADGHAGGWGAGLGADGTFADQSVYGGESSGLEASGGASPGWPGAAQAPLAGAASVFDQGFYDDPAPGGPAGPPAEWAGVPADGPRWGDDGYPAMSENGASAAAWPASEGQAGTPAPRAADSDRGARASAAGRLPIPQVDPIEPADWGGVESDWQTPEATGAGWNGVRTPADSSGSVAPASLPPDRPDRPDENANQEPAAWPAAPAVPQTGAVAHTAWKTAGQEPVSSDIFPSRAGVGPFGGAGQAAGSAHASLVGSGWDVRLESSLSTWDDVPDPDGWRVDAGTAGDPEAAAADEPAPEDSAAALAEGGVTAARDARVGSGWVTSRPAVQEAPPSQASLTAGGTARVPNPADEVYEDADYAPVDDDFDLDDWDDEDEAVVPVVDRSLGEPPFEEKAWYGEASVSEAAEPAPALQVGSALEQVGADVGPLDPTAPVPASTSAAAAAPGHALPPSVPIDADFARLALAVDVESAVRPGAPGTHPEFDRLARTIWRLRQADGCPWDRAQTHESITHNMIEEAYEAVDAIRAGDVPHLREELGDVLEQVLLHAQIAADEGEFTLDDVCRELNEKLVRRHPHVFGDAGAAADADAALDAWDEVKRGEREAAGAGGRVGLLDSVPQSLPALMQAQKISKRTAKVGFDWRDAGEVWEKVAEERAEFEAEPQGSAAATEEFGDLLFTLVNVARHEGIDAEQALAAACAKFRARWAAVEREAWRWGRDPEALSTLELNLLWERVKR